jgi:hypothetical protein
LCLPSLAAHAGLFTSASEDEEELTQQRTAIKIELEGMARVYSTLFRLEAAAVPLCPDDARWLPGFAVASAGHFPRPLREAAASMGYGDLARVVYVAAGSPAARAGLSAGDIIHAVAGREIDADKDAFEAVHRELAEIKSDAPVRLTVQSGGDPPREITISFVQACHYQPRLLRSHIVNAAATGSTIHVSTGLLDFLPSEQELAAVLAHEMAHSLMSHMAKKMGNLILGQALDSVLQAAAGPAGGLLVSMLKPGLRMGGRAYSQSFEIEADYVAMYVMALAGYDMASAPGIWRKMAVEFPDLLEHSYLGTHPASPERVLVQALTIDEIRAKLAAGEPLRPEVEQRVGDIKRGAD